MPRSPLHGVGVSRGHLGRDDENPFLKDERKRQGIISAHFSSCVGVSFCSALLT